MTIKKITQFLSCPYCPDQKLILRGKKLFCLKCHLSFDIIDGVPILLKESNLGIQEKKQRKFFDRHYSSFSKDTYQLKNWQQSMLKRIFENNFKDKVKTYLDIGCGATGYTVIEAAKRNNWLSLGIDISLEAVIKAKALAKKQGVEEKTAFLVASGEGLPFKSNLFDYTTALSVLEHLKDDTKAIREAFRVLKKAGHFYVCLPNAFKEIPLFLRPIIFYIDYRIGHQRHYSVKDLKRKLKKTGFELERFFYNGHWLKLVQIILEKPHLISHKNWWQIEKKDINQKLSGLHLNAIFKKVKT